MDIKSVEYQTRKSHPRYASRQWIYAGMIQTRASSPTCPFYFFSFLSSFYVQVRKSKHRFRHIFVYYFYGFIRFNQNWLDRRMRFGRRWKSTWSFVVHFDQGFTVIKLIHSPVVRTAVRTLPFILRMRSPMMSSSTFLHPKLRCHLDF